MAIKLNLTQIDPFSNAPLTEIKDECRNEGRAFYVCSVVEGEHSFLFEASMFTEFFLRVVNNPNAYNSLKNPLTKSEIHDFTVYRWVEDPDQFENAFTKQTAQNIDYYRVLVNDPNRSQKQKGELYYRMALCTQDEAERLQYLKKGAELGFRHAQVGLLPLLKDEKEYLYWALFSWENAGKETIQDCYHCARAFELNSSVESHKQLAFAFYQKGALLKSPYCLAVIIQYYELGYGVVQDSTEAEKLRRVLPERWQEKPISEYIKHLCTDPRLLEVSLEGDLPPESLQVDESLISQLAPEIKIAMAF